MTKVAEQKILCSSSKGTPYRSFIISAAIFISFLFFISWLFNDSDEIENQSYLLFVGMPLFLGFFLALLFPNTCTVDLLYDKKIKITSWRKKEIIDIKNIKRVYASTRFTFFRALSIKPNTSEFYIIEFKSNRSVSFQTINEQPNKLYKQLVKLIAELNLEKRRKKENH